MTEDFNKWWNSDGIAEENSYREGSPVFWAWEGWQAALKAEREPEPVAWMNEGDIGRTDWKVWAYGKPTATIPLYTAECMPDDLITTYEKGVIDGMQKQRQSSVDRAVNKMAQREWQGLTDEDVGKVSDEFLEGVLWAEAKLKEKNT